MTDRTNPASLKSRPSLLGRLQWILAAQLVALAVVLGAPMSLGLPAQVAVAATTSDGIVYEQREPGTVAITGYEGAGGRVEIPAQPDYAAPAPVTRQQTPPADVYDEDIPF